MKVATAKICLDCDELFTEEECPECLNKEYVFLSKWLPPLSTFNELLKSTLRRKRRKED